MKVADSERLKREILLRTLFPTMPAAAHLRFIELLEEVTAEAGEQVFELGATPDRFMFLIEGRVSMEHETLPRWEFAPFAVVGVVDAVLERQRTRNCRALEASRFLALRTSDWFDMLEDNGQVARAAIRNFATQLHARWQKQAPRLSRRSDVPPAAAGPLGTYEKILVLRRSATLRSAGMQAIASLATVAEPVSLQQGQLLFDVGNHDESLYFVVSGSLELSRIDAFRFEHQRGDLVGGPAPFCHALPGYAARALSDAVVLRIAQQDFYDQAEEHGRLTRGTLKYLVSELEALLQIPDAADVVSSQLSRGA